MEIKIGDIVMDRDATPFALRVVEIGEGYLIAKELTTVAASIRYKTSEYKYLTLHERICHKCDNTGVDYNALEMVCLCQRKL